MKHDEIHIFTVVIYSFYSPDTIADVEATLIGLLHYKIHKKFVGFKIAPQTQFNLLK